MNSHTFDVGVIGAGIMGLYSAYWLAKSGKSVVLFEQYPLGHDNGSSHGDGRIVRSLNDVPVLTELATKSLTHFHDLELICKDKFVHHCGCVAIMPKEELVKWENACKSAGINSFRTPLTLFGHKYEILTNKQCAARFPQINFPDHLLAIFSDNGGVAFADKIVAALIKELKRIGILILDNTSVCVAERTPHSVVLKGSKGTRFQTQKVVVTTGSWTNNLLSQAGLATLPIYASNEQVTYFPVANEKVDHTTNGKFPTTLVVFDDGTAFYSIPQVVNGVQGVKASIHQVGERIDPNPAKRSRDVNQELLKITQDMLIPAIHPHLKKEPSMVIRCLYTMTPDDLYFVGEHYEDKRFIVATGFCGTGFKHSPMIGRLVSQLVGEQTLEVDISAFSLTRFKDKAKL